MNLKVFIIERYLLPSLRLCSTQFSSSSLLPYPTALALTSQTSLPLIQCLIFFLLLCLEASHYRHSSKHTPARDLISRLRPQMISIQVPQYMNHHMSAYNPMSHQSYINGMGAISKPIQQLAKSGSAGAKRRPSRAGTRSVATLTSAQLERKRANDREAQRAIRQRTKDHIDSLERRISELTSNDDAAARLSQALQRNEELEQENKVLRSRLNQAVTAMAEGTPISADMLTGPESPTKKISRVQTRASSVPTAPRSIPTSIMTPTSLSTHHEEWNVPYASPISTDDGRSPSLGDVSPVSNTMRWGTPQHHQHQQPSPVMSDPGLVHEHHHQQQQQQQASSYGYMLDNHGRAVSYSPSAEYHHQHQHQQHYASSPAASDSLVSFHHQHQQQHTSGGGPMPLPSPAYSQYQPTTPQSFLAAAAAATTASPHEAENKYQQMLGQHSPVEPQSLMYGMAGAIKDD